MILPDKDPQTRESRLDSVRDSGATSIWREAAENVAESLTKGTRVIATGRLLQRSYETREGDNRTVVELQVDEVAPSLRYATARITRARRSEDDFGAHSGSAPFWWLGSIP